MKRVTRVAAGFQLLLGVCVLPASACGGDRAVPFKRPEADTGPDRKADEADASPTGSAPDAGLDRAAEGEIRGERHVTAPSAITVGGAPLERGQGHIYASLSASPDASVLLLAADEGGPLTLERAQRAGAGFATPAAVRTLDTSALGQCQVVSASLDAMSARHWIASASLSCAPPTQGAEGPEPASGAVEGAPEAGLHRRTWILDARSHMALERLTTHHRQHDPQLARPPAIDFTATDIDGDGHPDVVAHVDLTPGRDDDDFGFELQWLDRPSGLARHDREPEPTLMRNAERARRHLRRQPDEAIRLSREVLTWRQRLCRPSDLTVMSLGEAMGLPCRRSKAVARAGSVLATGLARQGDVAGALRARARMNARDAQPLPVDSKRANDALSSLPKGPSYRFVRGPKLRAQRLPPLHRPQVAFLDEGRLLMRGSPNRAWDIASNEVSATGAGGDLLITGPDGELTATEIFRDCDGYHVALVPSNQVVAGVVVGKPAATPLLLAAPKPHGATCPLTGSARRDDGGIVLEDYGSEGLRVRRDAREFLVAVGRRTQANEGHRADPGQTPEPTRADGSGGGRDTRASAFVMGDSIVVNQGGRARVIGASEIPSPISEVSVSPSGRRLAVVQGQQVWLGEPAEGEPKTPPIAP